MNYMNYLWFQLPCYSYLINVLLVVYLFIHVISGSGFEFDICSYWTRPWDRSICKQVGAIFSEGSGQAIIFSVILMLEHVSVVYHKEKHFISCLFTLTRTQHFC
jgi:hypothetical protein